MAETSLTQEELDSRIAVIKQFKKILEQQRNKFREYLTVLEKQQTAIDSGDTDILAAHAELEEHIVSNLAVLQKVAKPLAQLYRFTSGSNGTATALDSGLEIPHLQDDIAKLQEQVLSQNKKNRALLKIQMDAVRGKIEQVSNPSNNPFKYNRSVYATDSTTAHIVDVQL